MLLKSISAEFRSGLNITKTVGLGLSVENGLAHGPNPAESNLRNQIGPPRNTQALASTI